MASLEKRGTGFWCGKTVLVTGHTGFKGGWLALWLYQMGANVIGYGLNPPTNPNLFQIANMASLIYSVIGDILDVARFEKVLQDAQPDIVVHMAAQSLVRASYRDPVETFRTNVMGLVHVLEAIRKVDSIRVFLNVTTDKCYENKEWQQGYRETDPLGGSDPYSSSKACAELVSQSYSRSFFTGKNLVPATARAGNVIGGGDWAKDRLIPDIVRSFMNGKEVLIRNPHAARPWQHVLVPLSGYLQLMEKMWKDGPAFAGAWNFGPAPEDAKPVSYIVDYLSRHWGGDARWRLDEMQHPHEANLLKLDCTKAKTRLAWSPALDLDTALDWTIDWYQAYACQEDIFVLMLNQIEHFQMKTGVLV